MSSPTGHDWKLFISNDFGHHWKCSKCETTFWSNDHKTPDAEIKTVKNRWGVYIIDSCDVELVRLVHIT